LPEIGAAPDLVFLQGDQRILLRRTADGRWLKAVVKVTSDGAPMPVESLAWADEAEVRAMQATHQLVSGSPLGDAE
jgi:hypothetical protein